MPIRPALTGLVVTALLAGSLPATAASPAEPGAAGSGPAQQQTSTVALLTGDQVTVSTQPGGERTFSVKPAPRASGKPVTFTSAADGEHFYVIPSDASPYLATDVLDLRLFDVTALAAQGQSAASSPPPVIVQYDGARTPSAMARRGAALPGPELTLESIGAVAVDPTSGGVWTALTRSMKSRSADQVKKVWLDSKVAADLDVSVPQIGAPAVWQAGYDGTGVKVAVLDTGLDQQHPDLAGKVVGSQNFTDDASIADGNGHGTHVASIVTGTGAASGGQYKGVAPGASLMVGKVLTDAGTGFMSWAIEGMEWAARGGADVVNLSLSAPPTDGTDPGSLAVDALTAETGTLFVIASGNEYSDAAVGSPGAATAALTVGAVDDQDALADFSNRGPRRGDAAVKPNITAPGVGIVAARAAGTSLGSPVDDHHTSLSGTSMATPHVAGAAVLLAQAHPDWSATELKDALVSSAVPGDYTPFQQGAGRVDVARSLSQGVRGPAVADFGRVPDPATEPVARTLAYHNDTAAAVTLDLAVTGKGWDGRDVPAGAITLSQSSLTIPAGGTGTVELTADPAQLDTGVHSGIVAVTGSGSGPVSLRTPWSLYEASGSHTLSTSLLDRRGDPADPGLPIWVVKTDPGFVANDPFRSWNYFAWSDSEGNATLDLAPGVYDVYAQVTTWELDATESTIAIASEVRVGADTAVTLDARQAHRRNPRVGEDVNLLFGEVSVIRHTPDDREFRFGALFEESTDWKLFSTATPKPELGWTESFTKWTYGSELVSVRGSGVPALHPEYWPFAAGPALAGRRTLPVVVADTDAELQQARGKLALVRVAIPPGEPFPYSYFIIELARRTELAAQAGVAGVIAYADLPGAQAHQVRAEPILQLGLSRDEGEQLRKLAEQHRELTLTIDGRQSPERVYHLRLGYDGGFPAAGDPVVSKDELATMPAQYHSDTPQQQGQLAWFAFSPNMPDSSQIAIPFRAPVSWTELAASRGPQLRWLRQTWLEDTALRAWDVIRPGERRPVDRWFQSPVTYGAMDVEGDYPTALTCTFCRQGDRFVTGQYRMDASGKHYEFAWFDPPEVRLFRGDTEIPRQGSSWRWFQLPPGAGTYRLNMRYTQPGSAPGALAPRVATDWVFRSAPPSAGTLPAAYTCPFSADANPCGFDPLIQLHYDLGLTLANTALAEREHSFDVHAAPLSGAVDQTQVAGMSAWYSTDDGQTWKAGSVRKKSKDTFAVTVRHPRLADTNGFVWLRVRAWNDKGDSVEQTVERAYRLEDR